MKKTYVIGYDKKEGQDYAPLILAIKEIGVGTNFLDSTFVIKSGLPATQIIQKLEPYLDRGNKLIVAEVTENSDWDGFTIKQSEALEKLLH